jgi:hypothetical protein
VHRYQLLHEVGPSIRPEVPAYRLVRPHRLSTASTASDIRLAQAWLLRITTRYSQDRIRRSRLRVMRQQADRLCQRPTTWCCTYHQVSKVLLAFTTTWTLRARVLRRNSFNTTTNTITSRHGTSRQWPARGPYQSGSQTALYPYAPRVYTVAPLANHGAAGIPLTGSKLHLQHGWARSCLSTK